MGMTIKKMIKALEKLDKKYPRTEVCVDFSSRNAQGDDDWTHRAITGMEIESIHMTKDGESLSGSESQVVALKIF